MLTRRLAALALAAAVVASGSACGRGSTGPKEYKKVERNEQVPMKLSIIVDGDLKARFVDRVVNTQIVMLDTDDPELESARIYGIQPAEPVVTDGVAFLAGFAVVPFEGDGTYTIKQGSVQDAAGAEQGGQAQSVDKSSVQVQWWPSGDIAKETFQYLRRAKPCTVRVADKGARGRLDCPEVTQDATETRFSLEMRWEPA